jgi:hypothetical protein
MLILKILFQVSAVLLALLTSSLDYVFRDRRTRQFKQLRVALYCIAVLSLVIAVVVTVTDDAARKRETETLRNELSALHAALSRTSDAITGGRSFAYVNILHGRLLLINEGSDPMYDFSARMWDPSDYKNATTSGQFEASESRALRFAVATIPPKSVQQVATVPLPTFGYRAFEVTMVARNGAFSQQFVMKYVDGSWRSAYRVFRGLERVESAKLLERTDPMFPRDQRGAPIWQER